MIVVFREENSHRGRNSLRLEHVEDIEIVENFGNKSSVIVYGDGRADLVATSKNAQEIYNTILLNEI